MQFAHSNIRNGHSYNSKNIMFSHNYIYNMFRIKNILILSLLFFFSGVRAQSLYFEKHNGPYILLYKLNAEQVKFLLENPDKKDTQILYTQLAGKVHTDSIIPLCKKPVDSFPIKPFYNKNKYDKNVHLFHIWDITENGYYLEVTVNYFQVQYRLIENPLFQASVYTIGNETFVFAEDTAGIPVYNAKITLDTNICLFDSSIGGYKIKNKKLYGLLKIERNGIFTFHELKNPEIKNNTDKIPADKYKYGKLNYQGYLVTNKPRYKHWDTLFFKSFLVNKKGKPIREKLYARLYQNQSGYAKEFEIKPEYKGDYNGFFIINDSFYLDHQASIVLLNKKRKIIKSQDIYIEDYSLKDIQFSVVANKTLVTPGEGIKIYANAFNANGLPIMDGKIMFHMYLNHVNYTDEDSVVIPFHKSSNWYSSVVQTSPSGVTEFDLPDSIFTALDGQFNVRCILQTSDYETKEVLFTFNYQTTRDRQEAALRDDTLYVDRFYNMKRSKREMRMKVYSRTDLLADSTFFTPYKAYISPNVYMVQIFRGDTLTGTFYRQTMLPQITGKRTHDSVFINIQSKKDIRVFYRIYANNILVHSGQGTELIWKKRDKSKQSYHLQYGILEGSVTAPRFYSKSFHLAEKQITVEINQPEIIYPGQEVPIEIIVKDAYGRPVNKANLAAWAINMQMEGIEKPDVPYLGLVKTQRPLNIKNIAATKPQLYSNSLLKDWQINAFYLRENKFFQLLFPVNGFQVLTEPTPFNSTELDFFAHGQYFRQNIAWVKSGDSLIWIPNNAMKPNVIRIKPGTYDFEIRTFNKIHRFKNVTISEGKKNFICLQTDTLDKLSLGSSVHAGLLSQPELEMISSNSLLFRYDILPYDTLIIKVNGQIRQAVSSGSNLHDDFRTVRIAKGQYNPIRNSNSYNTYDDFHILAPVKNGDVVEFIWKNGYSHLVTFKPGIAHSFTKNDQVNEMNLKWISEISFLQAKNNMPLRLSSFWFDPYQKPIIKIQTETTPSIVYTPPKIPLPVYQYKNYSKTNTTPYSGLLSLYTQNTYYPQKIWLFNNDDSTNSILENWTSFQYQYNEVGMISRKNLLLRGNKNEQQKFTLLVQMNDSLWMVKNIEVDTSAHLYLYLHPTEFRRLKMQEYIMYDRLAKSLVKTPLIKWEDTLTENKNLYIFPLKSKENKTLIEGTIVGPGIQYPVENAFVVLESNGKYVQGAFTNNEGRFIMENLNPGIYMLKIKATNYHYWVHYSVQITRGHNHILQARLIPYARFSSQPDYTFVDGDFDGVTESHIGYTQNNYASPAYEGNAIAYASVAKSMKKKASFSLSESKDQNSNATYIDGVRIASKMDRKAEIEEPSAWSEKEQEKERDRLNVMATDQGARRIRKEFKDYAYWKPVLITNKKGKVGFTVKFPDNSTSWQTFVPAMDGKRHSGLGELVVKSYKPVTATLSIPAFVNETDTFLAFSKIYNYTGTQLTGKYSFLQNNQVKESQVSFQYFYTDSTYIAAGKPGDTILLANSFEMSNGYLDGELRKTPVYAATVTDGKSWFYEINNDTTIVFQADSNDLSMDIVVYNQKLAMISDILKKIEALPAYDIYSLSNYLTALLIKKSISETLTIPFEQEKQIRETISLLKKSQNPDGLFGWFKGSKNSFVVSTKAAEALFLAHNSGYENNAWLTAANRIEKQLPNSFGLERLEYLLCLKRLNRKVDYDSLLKPFVFHEMNSSMKLKLMRLHQLLGKKTDISAAINLIETTYEGNLKVSGTWDWKYAQVTDDVSNTYLCWEILYAEKSNPIQRMAMTEFLLSECKSQSLGLILAAKMMMKEAESDSNLNKSLKTVVTINGKTLEVHEMPATFRVKPGDKLTLQHKGGPIYVAGNRKYKTYDPISNQAEFKISSRLKNKNDYKLVSGKPVEMEVTVFAKRNQFNCVIEVPIPAGCVYGQKIQAENYTETHRQYLTDRVLIFAEEMPFGYHTFTVKLTPKFDGVFHTAPARSALMFYPDKADFTKKQRWSISQ